MNYDKAIGKLDIRRIDKLNKLTNLETFWDDVRFLAKRVRSGEAFIRWQCLAEIREDELRQVELLKSDLFMLQMKDRWDMNDRNRYYELCNQIEELKGDSGYGFGV